MPVVAIDAEDVVEVVFNLWSYCGNCAGKEDEVEVVVPVVVLR